MGGGRSAAVLAFGLVLAASGCMRATVRTLYANQFACDDSQIRVKEIAPERYRASGCGEALYECVNDDTCYFRRTLAVPEAAAEEAAPAWTRRAAKVRRESKHGKVTVAIDVQLDRATTLNLRARPGRKRSLVQLKLVHTGQKAALKDCDISFLINGQLFPPLDGHLTEQRAPAVLGRDLWVSSLRSDLSQELIRELGTARRFALRACEHRWSFDLEQLTELLRFVELYEEELAWKGPVTQGGTGGLLAPPGGWPAWTTAGVPPAAVQSTPLDAPALFKLVAPAIFQLEVALASGTSQGSAVAVTPSELLTSCHVIEGARRITARQGKTKHILTIVRADPATDRCVLAAPGPVLTPARGVRSYADLQIGEALFTLGAPNGLELTLSDGILSGLREEHGRRFVQTTAPISPGSSGGGLFDARGNLVGITTLVLVGRERLNQSLNFATPAEAFWKP